MACVVGVVCTPLFFCSLICVQFTFRPGGPGAPVPGQPVMRGPWAPPSSSSVCSCILLTDVSPFDSWCFFAANS